MAGFIYYLTGSYRRSNGFPLSQDFSPALHEDGDLAEQSGFHKYNLSLNIGYDVTPVDTLAIVIGYYQAELDVPPNIFGGGTGRRRLRFTRFTDWERSNVDLYGQTKLLENLTLKGNAYFDRFSDDLVIFSDGTYSTINSKSRFLNTSIGTNLQATWAVHDDVVVKVGTFFKYDKHVDKSLTDSFRSDEEALTTDYFLESDWALTNKLNVSAGLNYDVMYTGGNRTIDSWNPRGAVTLRPWPNSRWQVAIGQKSRMPRLLNLFAGRGNLHLKPETNFVMELSANQLFWNGRIEVNLTGFRNDVDNMIVFQTPAGGSRTQDQNAVSFISHGIEGNITTNFTKAISWTVDYTYIDQVFENRGDAIFNDGYHQLNSQVAFRTPWGIGVFLQGSYVNFGTPSKPKISSTVGDDTFVLLNGKISYTFAKN